jgi:hypothetical protein
MRTIRPPCIGQLLPVGLLVHLWSTVKRLQANGYSGILLFPVNGYEIQSGVSLRIARKKK